MAANLVEVAAVSREAAVVANREAVVSLKKADVAAVLINWKFTIGLKIFLRYRANRKWLRFSLKIHVKAIISTVII